MIPVLGLEKVIKIDIKLREHAFVRRRVLFMHRSEGRVFGGDMFMIMLLHYGLWGLEESGRGVNFIPLEWFILIGVLNDTIPAHWDLLGGTGGSGH
jgi:hypothetical protein